MKFREYILSDIVDLKIGRTPPRKESKWFNVNTENFKWVSIKDMGSCGKYISDTSENISLEGQGKFNIPIVKDNTVLLSFKLTVGRVAITRGEMLTNEAIAQLPIKNPEVVDTEYLYYYLKNYKYETLGSTSSIATAVNSNYLKNMKLELPDLCTQKKIANILSVIDDKIEKNEQINNNLAA